MSTIAFATHDGSLPLAIKRTLNFETQLRSIELRSLQNILSLDLLHPVMHMKQLLEDIKHQEGNLPKTLALGIHSAAVWINTKKLAFLYFVVSHQFLFKNKFQNFLLFNKKSLYVLEEPTKDSQWTRKVSWRFLQLINLTYYALYLCKVGHITDIVTLHLSIKDLYNSLLKQPKGHYVLAKFILSFALIQKQLDDNCYMSAFKQAADLMMNVYEQNQNEEKPLIYYLIYKYAKYNKNMLQVQQDLNKTFAFINNNYNIVQTTNDEVLLYHKLQAIYKEIGQKIDKNDKSSYIKIDKKYQKNWKKIIKQEQDEYLDQSDIDIFQAIAQQQQQLPLKNSKIKNNNFMIKNQSYSTKELQIPKPTNLNNNSSLINKANINAIRMQQAYNLKTKKGSSMHKINKVIQIKEDNKVLAKNYEMINRPQIKQNNLQKSSNIFLNKLSSSKNTLHSKHMNLKTLSQKHLADNTLNTKQDFDHSKHYLQGTQYSQLQEQKSSYLDNQDSQQSNGNEPFTPFDKETSKGICNRFAFKINNEKKLIDQQEKIQEKIKGENNILMKNIKHFITEYVAEEILNLNEEDEEDQQENYKNRQKNRVPFEKLSLDIQYQLENIDLVTQQNERDLQEKNDQEQQQIQKQAPKTVMKELDAVVKLQGYVRTFLFMKQETRDKKDKYQKVLINQLRFIRSQKSYSFSQLDNVTATNIIKNDPNQQQYMYTDHNDKFLKNDEQNQTQHFAIKKNEAIKENYTINIIKLTSVQIKKYTKILTRQLSLFSKDMKFHDNGQLQKSNDMYQKLCDDFKEPKKQNENSEDKIQLKLNIFEKFYLVDIKFELTQQQLVMDYTLSRYYTQQKLKINIPIPIKFQKQIQEHTYQIKIKQIILMYLKQNLTKSSLKEIQSCLISLISKHEVENLDQIQKKQMIILQTIILRKCIDYKTKYNGRLLNFTFDHQTNKNNQKKLIDIQKPSLMQKLYYLNQSIKMYQFNQINDKYQIQIHKKIMQNILKNNKLRICEFVETFSKKKETINLVWKLNDEFMFLTLCFSFQQQFLIHQFYNLFNQMLNSQNFAAKDFKNKLNLCFEFQIKQLKTKQNQYQRLKLDKKFIDNIFDSSYLQQCVTKYILMGKYEKQFILTLIKLIEKNILIKDQKILHKDLTNEQKLFPKIDEKKIFQKQFQFIHNKQKQKIKKEFVGKDKVINNLFEKNFDQIYNQDFKNKRFNIFDIKEDLENKKSNIEVMAHQNTSSLSPNKNEIQQKKQISNEQLNQIESDKNQICYLRIKNKQRNLIFFFKLCKNQNANQCIYITQLNQIHQMDVTEKKILTILKNSLEMKKQYNLPNNLQQNITILSCFKVKKKLNGINYESQTSSDNDKINSSLIMQSYKSIKTNVLKDTHQLSEIFNQQNYHFLDKFKNLGKCVVSINIYTNKKQLMQKEFNFFVSFKIYPYNHKTKLYKFILDKHDIQEHFQNEIDFKDFKKFNSRCFINKMKSIFQKMNLMRFNLYNQVIFNQQSQTNNENQFLRRNKINELKWKKNLFIKYDLNNQMEKSQNFLDKYVNEKRIIGQFVKKIDNQYVIITISKSLLLQNWNLQIYFSKTSRKFQAYIQKDDFMKFKIQQLRQIIPFVFTEIFKRQQQYINYKDFDTQYLQFQKFVYQNNKRYSSKTNKNKQQLKSKLQTIVDKFYQIIKKDKKKENQQKDMKAPINTFEKDNDEYIFDFSDIRENFFYTFIIMLLQEKKMKKTRLIVQLLKLTEKISSQMIQRCGQDKIVTHSLNFLEIRIWQNILENSVIIQEENNMDLTCFKNFIIPLKEILFIDHVQIDKHNDNVIEIYLELSDEDYTKSDFFSNFEPITYAKTSNQKIHIRTMCLNKLNISQKQINLREIINLYIADGFYKFQNNYMNSQLNLSELHNLCNFIIYKIKTSNFANLLHDSSANKKVKHTKTQNIQFNQQIIDAHEAAQNIQSYRQILTKDPQQIIRVEFFQEQENICINVFQTKHGNCWNMNLSYKEIYNKFQLFYFLLAQQNFRVLGEKIIDLYKKSLIFESVYQFQLAEK